MIKKTIKFEDFEGREIEKDCWFHLSDADLADLQFSAYGGLHQILENIIKENDTVKIYEYFTTIVKKSYGEKTADGISFIKTKEITDKFVGSPAYSVLLMELIGDSNKAADFVNGVIQKKRENNPIPAPAVK